MNISKHFEFNEWHKAFAYFDELNKQKIENLRMVISTHWATTGYWIENSIEQVSSEDHVYAAEQVPLLKQRVISAIDEARTHGHNNTGLIL